MSISLAPLLTADGAEIKPGLYLQDGRTLYKVSGRYSGYVTLQVCWEHGTSPVRTTIRPLADSQVTGMQVAGGRQIQRYHDFLDGKSDKPRKPLGPMTVHEFEQDPDKTGSACRFCGLDKRNPCHKDGAGTL